MAINESDIRLKNKLHQKAINHNGEGFIDMSDIRTEEDA